MRITAEEAAWYNTQRRAKESSAIALLDTIARAPLAATFTGDDTRRERDAIAEAFKTALAPWILVATTVGPKVSTCTRTVDTSSTSIWSGTRHAWSNARAESIAWAGH